MLVSSLLGLVTGAASGVIVIAFREAIEWLSRVTRGQGSEAFEELPGIVAFGLPLGTALVIGIALNWAGTGQRRVGVSHVLERLAEHQGSMPVKSALVQFFGGVVGLVGGLSGGREGPAIHLGAAISNWIGRALMVPLSATRTLIACGSAAAIAGSFNTPLAGVIFAMEVILMEYTMATFLPVIVAAVTATVITHFHFGDAPAFAVPPIELNSLVEIPLIGASGIVVGMVAIIFVTQAEYFARFRFAYWMRAGLAGVITGVAALVSPAIMGVGYDTVNAALLGQVPVAMLLLIVLAKTVSAAACTGFGLPVGVIGPTLVIGAALGGVLGYVGHDLAPGVPSEPGLYVMLGMAAMMAAVLQAPLAALVAVFELTESPNVILPAMLIIVCATLTARIALKGRSSIFIARLHALGVQYPPDALSGELSRISVLAVMDDNIAHAGDAMASMSARWILADGSEQASVLLDGEQNPIASAPIDARATLREARDLFVDTTLDALIVHRSDTLLPIGVVTRQHIEDRVKF